MTTIKYETMYIYNLVTKVFCEDIVIPTRLRSFEWSNNDVLEFWDSVYKQYPLGTITLCDVGQKTTSGYDLHVIDGQNRLMCLCGTLHAGLFSEYSDMFSVGFDLVKMEFVHGCGENVFPLNAILNTVDFLREVEKIDDLHLKSEADRLSTIPFRTNIQIVTVCGASDKEVEEIESRI